MSGRGGKFKRGGFKSAAYIKKKRSSPGEDDTASRASKKAKAEEEDEEDESTPFVPTLKKDEQGDSYVGVCIHLYAEYMYGIDDAYDSSNRTTCGALRSTSLRARR
jgi:hypothetical protein